MTPPAALPRPRRSALYMPGSNARALDKARTLEADVVIMDLEDAVAPDAKAEARRAVVQAVTAGGYGRREVVIRVNGANTPWGAADMAAVAVTRADAVLFPKVESGVELRATIRLLDAAGGSHLPVWVMAELPQAVLAIDAIAQPGAAGRGHRHGHRRSRQGPAPAGRSGAPGPAGRAQPVRAGGPGPGS